MSDERLAISETDPSRLSSRRNGDCSPHKALIDI